MVGLGTSNSTTTSSSSNLDQPLNPTMSSMPTELPSSSPASSAPAEATPMDVASKVESKVESAGGAASFSLPRALEGLRMVDLGTSSSSSSISSASSSSSNLKQPRNPTMPSMPAGQPSSSAAFLAAAEVTPMDVVPDADLASESGSFASPRGPDSQGSSGTLPSPWTMPVVGASVPEVMHCIYQRIGARAANLNPRGYPPNVVWQSGGLTQSAQQESSEEAIGLVRALSDLAFLEVYV